MSEVFPPSARTKVKRLGDRGRYDAATVHAILDAGLLAHVGYVIDGAPFVTPTLHWREGDHVYWHGSSASRFLEKAEGAEVCLTVSLTDGLVLARSAFNHSVNYRSVMALGRAYKVSDPAEKAKKLENFVENILPGRWPHLRPMTAQEMKATMILGLSLDEASAKIRVGGPKDEPEDYGLPIWAGVIPLETRAGAPIADPKNLPGLETPEHVARWRPKF